MNNSYASDTGHYYYRDGRPCYTVIGKNGKERNTNIRDARKLDLVPSVTEVMKLIAKPGLEKWKYKQVLLSALTLTRGIGETDGAFIERILADAQEQSRVAAEKGTMIHGAIERTLLKLPVDPDFAPYANTALAGLEFYLGIPNLYGQCEAEKSFADLRGFGGKIDLHSKSLNFVVDFKGKDFKDNSKALTLPDNKIQLAAYAEGVGMPMARLINVFVSREVVGLIQIEEHDKNSKWFGIFMSMLSLWGKMKSA
jgi:hypothetical protein